jgi:hypothetical protein
VSEVVVDAFVDFLEEPDWETFAAVYEADWDEIVYPVVSEILALFGIDPETVVSTETVSVKLYGEQSEFLLSNALTRMAVEYSKNSQKGLLASFVKNTDEATSKINGYYNYSVTNYPYGLPTTNIRGGVIDKVAVKAAVDSELSINSEILSATQSYIDQTTFYRNFLQDNYSYLPYTNTLTFTDEFGTFSDYNLQAIVYEPNDNTYNINVERTGLKVKAYLSGTSEVVQGEITEEYVLTLDRVLPPATTLTVNLTYAGTAVEGTHYTAVASVTVQENTNTVSFSISTIESSIASGQESLIVSIDSLTSQTVYEEFEVAENRGTITTNINFDAATPVFTDNFIVETLETTQVVRTINRPSYVPASYIIVRYYTIDENQWFYWLYDTTLGTYPEIETTVDNLTNIEMMPIGIIRTDAVTVSPESIGQENFDGVVKLVKTLGIKFDDLVSQIESSPTIANLEECFLLFAVDPKDESEQISKVLFEMFYPLTQTSSSTFNQTTNPVNSLQDPTTEIFTATFSEQNINRSLVWTKQEFYFQDNVIGVVGTYSHYITDIRLYLVKQISPTVCIFIVLHNLSAMEFISVQGLNKVKASKLSDPNFSIPLSRFAVNSLSPIEQLQLYPFALRLNLYAVELQYLEAYETEDFFDFVQIVIIVVAIIIAYFTWGTGTEAWVSFAQAVLTSYAITYAATAIIANLDNDYAKLVVAAIAVAFSIYAGGTSVDTAQSILQSVTMFSEFYTDHIALDLQETAEKLQEVQQVYGTRIEEIQKLQEAVDNNSGLNVEYLAYLNSPSTSIYRAIQIQYDFSQVYNYDTLVGNYHENALKIGVV